MHLLITAPFFPHLGHQLRYFTRTGVQKDPGHAEKTGGGQTERWTGDHHGMHWTEVRYSC